MQQQITLKVSDRSMRRVQIVMAAMQAAEQTAQAAAQAAQGMADQARKSLDDALGAICDAHDEQLPQQYTLTVRPKENTVIITSDEVPPPSDGDILPERFGGPSDATLEALGIARLASERANGDSQASASPEPSEGTPP